MLSAYSEREREQGTWEMLAWPVALSDKVGCMRGCVQRQGQGWSRMALEATLRLLEFVLYEEGTSNTFKAKNGLLKLLSQENRL